MLPVLPLDQALVLVFAADWLAVKLIYGHTWIYALWVNIQIFMFLFVCVLACAVMGPLGLVFDFVLALGALAYSISGEA